MLANRGTVSIYIHICLYNETCIDWTISDRQNMPVYLRSEWDLLFRISFNAGQGWLPRHEVHDIKE